MKKSKLLLMLSLFVILMTVVGNVCAQDNVPAFKVSSVVSDEKVVLTTKDFPADMSYTVSMADPENPDVYTAVAKFNSKTGGSLNVTVKIPEKFQGLNVINVQLVDANGARITGNFVNIEEPVEEVVEEPVADEAEAPAEEPVADEAEAPAEEPAADEAETPAEEPAADEAEAPAEEPAADEAETPAEEPAADEAEAPAEEPAADEAEAPAEEPAADEAETPAEEPAADEAEAPAEEPAADETEVPAEEPAADEAETPAEEPAADEAASDEMTISLVNQTPAEEPAADETEETVEEPVAEEAVVEETAAAAETPALVCDFSVIPTVTIDAVTRNETVTFTTYNFPANSTFSVSMGAYVETWVPAPAQPYPPMGRQPQPRAPQGSTVVIPNHFEPEHLNPNPNGKPEPKPQPQGHVNVSFSGTEVSTFETGDGSSQTLTFAIPSSVQGMGTIALWIEDLGSCGFYSYNYFYNTSTN